MSAAINGQSEAIKVLLDNGATPNQDKRQRLDGFGMGGC